MKRIVLTALSTITGIVLLLGVKSQTGAPGMATLAAPGAGSAGSGSTATKRTPTPDVTRTPTATGTPTPTSKPTPRKKKLTTKKKSSAGSKTKTTSKPKAAPAAPKKVAPKPKPVMRVKVVGQTADTPYGPVQVKVTMLGHRITDVTALQLPGGNQRSSEIAGFAAPELRKEALSAQSAHIDSVSGATYTSQGYITSLQSALDKAGA